MGGVAVLAGIHGGDSLGMRCEDMDLKAVGVWECGSVCVRREKKMDAQRRR
jgi:hypothetical protein